MIEYFSSRGGDDYYYFFSSVKKNLTHLLVTVIRFDYVEKLVRLKSVLLSFSNVFLCVLHYLHSNFATHQCAFVFHLNQ